MGKKLPEAVPFLPLFCRDPGASAFPPPPQPPPLLCEHLPFFGGAGGEMPVDLTVTVVPSGVSSYDWGCPLPTSL